MYCALHRQCPKWPQKYFPLFSLNLYPLVSLNLAPDLYPPKRSVGMQTKRRDAIASYQLTFTHACVEKTLQVVVLREALERAPSYVPCAVAYTRTLNRVLSLKKKEVVVVFLHVIQVVSYEGPTQYTNQEFPRVH